MDNTHSSPPSAPLRRMTVRALAVAAFVLLLFPPLSWIAGGAGVWYFLIASTVGLALLIIMYAVDGPDAGE
jgi:hypothetical protein